MELSSPDFEHKRQIPTNCTCDGDNLPPELHWSDLPEGTVELALTCEDVDAPGGTFVHWVLWGLRPSPTTLSPGEDVNVKEGRNDFEATGYGGPCPPPGHGHHHYHLRLYALSDHVDLPDGSSINELRRMIDGKVIDTAELIGVYSR